MHSFFQRLRTGVTLAAACAAIASLGWAQTVGGNAPPAPNPPAAASASGMNAFEQGSEVFLNVPAMLFSSSNETGQPLSTTDSAGIDLGVRMHLSKWNAVDVRWGWSSNTHNYNPTWSQQAHANEFSANYVLTLPSSGRLHFYGLAGGGLLHFGPTSNGGNYDLEPNGAAASAQTKAMLDYGVGVETHLVGHFNARLELRELNFKAPDFNLGNMNGVAFSNWTALTEPSIGIGYSF